MGLCLVLEEGVVSLGTYWCWCGLRWGVRYGGCGGIVGSVASWLVVGCAESILA